MTPGQEESRALGTGETSGPSRDALDAIFADMMALDGDEETFLKQEIRGRVDELRRRLVGARIGPYQILEEIAAGAMGVVFKARQESPMFTREAAIKFLIAGPDANDEARERFVAEAKGLASLKHPALVPIFDSGIEGDLYYFTMELIDGEPLADVMERGGLSLTRKVEIARDVGRALEYLHAHGVVHRDVKPGNVMIDRQGMSRLLDFGIAQFSADAGRRAVQAGTPHFMAPEVIDPTGPFGPIGPATDVYALGAVLYRLVYGRPVFAGRRIGEVLERALAEEPAFSRKRWERAPRELERILARALAKRVDDRYPTATELVRDLDAFLLRRSVRAPLGAAAGLVVLAAFLVLFVHGDREPAKRLTDPQVDLKPWRERLEAVEAVNGSMARDLAQSLDSIDAEPDPRSKLRALSALSEELDRFWKEKTDAARAEAQQSRRDYVDVPVSGDGKSLALYTEGNEAIDRASALRPDRSAYDLLHGAADKFVEARRLAVEALARRVREEETREAAAAREAAIAARDALEQGNGLDVRGEAGKPLADAKSRLREAGEASSRSDFRAAKVKYSEAESLYRRAQGLASAGFETRRAYLAGLVERVGRQLRADETRIERNLGAAAAGGLLSALAAAKTSLDAGRLASCEDSLRSLLHRWGEAKTKVGGMEADARRAGEAARAALASPPAVEAAEADLAAASAAVATGRKQLEDSDFAGARSSFEEAASRSAAARRRAERVTAGMAWVSGGAGVDGFWIDRREVSVAEYASFLQDVEEHGHGRCCAGEAPRDHAPARWAAQAASRLLPVVGVRLADAQAFARWRGKALPAEQEWRTAAARGAGGKLRAYPYGDAFDARLSNGEGAADGFSGLAPTDALPGGASPCGCLQLSGNAAEWTMAEGGSARDGVILGGSFLTGEPDLLRCDARFAPGDGFESSEGFQRAVGFRCVLRPVKRSTSP